MEIIQAVLSWYTHSARRLTDGSLTERRNHGHCADDARDERRQAVDRCEVGATHFEDEVRDDFGPTLNRDMATELSVQPYRGDKLCAEHERGRLYRPLQQEAVVAVGRGWTHHVPMCCRCHRGADRHPIAPDEPRGPN